MKKIMILILSLVLMFAMAACSRSNEEHKIAIRGEITNLSEGQNNKTIFIMVEGVVEKDTEFDKASITITEKTKVVEKDSNKKLSKEALKEGMKVEVIIEGPVRESYPVQVDAKEVRILE